MHRSSESVAGLATALAKAQIELVNPEKSLVANIRSDRRGESNQSFRYASLSSGLDIVRKTLGRHEIAVMQTTAFDAASGLVNLTTLLAHTTGEWISSDWPVCPMSDIATPHRMGAALTYARRYALFALVGIAGDDDLDAPDLNIGNGQSVYPASTSDALETQNPGANGSGVGSPGNSRKDKKLEPNGRQPILTPDESTELRAQLLKEITILQSVDTATNWAPRALAIKNKLTKADAQAVEQAFATRMTAINEDNPVDRGSAAAATMALAGKAPAAPLTSDAGSQGPDSSHFRPVDKQGLLYGVTPRRRDKAHLRFVATKACLVCGRQPSDPHHLRFAQPRALSRKVSDEFTVPLCRSHHREVHRRGNESKWWSGLGIDPIVIAGRLWNETHGKIQPIAAGLGETLPKTSRRKRNSNDFENKGAEGPSYSNVGGNGHDHAKAD